MADIPPACSSGLPAPFLRTLSAVRDQLCLVTGGAGFLGGHICSLLIAAGARVRVFDVMQPKPGNDAWKKEDNVEVIVGNLLTVSDVDKAVARCWCVIHVASPSPTSRNAALFQSVNVDGTQVLLDACKRAGVKRFVYTSSASVVFDGQHQRNLDERAPPPLSAMDDYTRSKLSAEQLVLRTNGAELWTTAIRPHGIFGARDPHFLPVLAQTGAAGKSRYQIGDGSNLVDFTYVENVAFAHVLAAVKLAEGSPVNGQAYFITNREPVFFWSFIARMHREWGYTQPWLVLPVWLMKPMGKLAERVGEMFHFRPTFTTQAINYAGSAHYYSAAKAVRELGYTPPIDMEEAMRRSVKYFWELRNKSPLAVRDRVKKGANKKQDANAVYGTGLIASALLKQLLGVLALLFVLHSSNCTKTFWLLFAALVYYVWGVYRESFGVTPVMAASVGGGLSAQKNQTILITGANRGLGFHAACEFLEHGYGHGGNAGGRLIITCRDAKKAGDAAAALQAKYPSAASAISGMVLDLGSFASISACVLKLKADGRAIDILVNNAGAMLPAGVTADGRDEQFQSNYLGAFYFTRQLLALAVLAPAARIVNVSSMMHRLVGPLYRVRMGDLQDLGGGPARPNYDRIGMYCKTKLLQVLWTAKQQREFDAAAVIAREKYTAQTGDESATKGMARRCIVSVNPGAVATDFIHYFIPASLASALDPLLMFLVQKTPKHGVQSIVYAACAQQMENVGGVYVDNCNVCIPAALAKDEQLQEEVWKASLALCPQK